MNSTQLNCFVAVADSLSFARAAEKLHITQPAVTHQINSLENELDVKLFKRTTRSVELTREGFGFLADAKSILSTISLAKVRFSSAEKNGPIPFSIGCRSGELNYIAELLKPMFSLYPSIHPYVKTLPYQVLMNLLQNESIDVVFGLQYSQDTKQTMHFRELSKAPVVCAMCKDHPLSFKKNLTQADFSHVKIAIMDRPHALSPMLSLQNTLLSAHTTSDLYFCESMEDIFTIVKTGMAVTFVPDILPMRDPVLSYVPIQSSLMISYGIYYKTLQRKPMLKDFLRIAGTYFEEKIFPEEKA